MSNNTSVNISSIELTNNGCSAGSIADKIFFPLLSFNPQQPFTLTVFDNTGSQLVQFKCVLTDGGDLAHYRTKMFSYTATDSKWRLQRILPHAREVNFYAYVTNGSTDKLFEIIFTD